MKSEPVSSSLATAGNAGRFPLPRFRVCHRSGENHERRFATDSAEAAVQHFLTVAPLDKQDDLYIWDRQEKRIVAQLEWIEEKTTFGFTIPVRSNQFHESSFTDIARNLCERAEIRRAVVNGVGV